MRWIVRLLARWGLLPYNPPVMVDDDRERDLQRRLDVLDATIGAQQARRETEARHERKDGGGTHAAR